MVVKYLNKINSIADDSKYLLWYNNLIKKAYLRANNRKTAELLFNFVEGHHILPVCLGTTEEIKDKENIVFLSLREHFIAHVILLKVFNNNIKIRAKMLYAVSAFSFKRKVLLNSRQYEFAKTASKISAKGREVSLETKTKLSNLRKGRTNMWDTNGILYPNIAVDDPIIKEKNLHGNKYKTTTYKDSLGNTKTIHCDDPILLSGEYVGVASGMATYKDSSGKKYRLNVDSDLIKELNLKHIATGTKLSDETKNKLSIQRTGKNNSMAGRINEVCCFDLLLEKFCRISKNEFYNHKGIRYVGPNNKVAKEFRNKQKSLIELMQPLTY